jgi:mycothiol system anti-sigma-R factor
MSCEDVQENLSAFLDGALPHERQRAIEAHLASCPKCAGQLEDYREIARVLREKVMERAPAGLQERIRAEITRQAGDNPPSHRWWLGQRAARAAALLLVAGLSATGGWFAATTGLQTTTLAHDVATAHIRSLLQDNLTHIASSDRHVVKPWFAGRLDFAAPVQDLNGHGFPLRGGRLEYIGSQRVAAMVYMRRQHVISLFAWPADSTVPPLSPPEALKGYNTIRWTSGGMEYWAISDLNPKELSEFQALLNSS